MAVALKLEMPMARALPAATRGSSALYARTVSAIVSHGKWSSCSGASRSSRRVGERPSDGACGRAAERPHQQVDVWQPEDAQVRRHVVRIVVRRQAGRELLRPVALAVVVLAEDLAWTTRHLGGDDQFGSLQTRFAHGAPDVRLVSVAVGERRIQASAAQLDEVSVVASGTNVDERHLNTGSDLDGSLDGGRMV